MIEDTITTKAKKKVTIDIFHDERFLIKEGWLYHGMLFVPVDQEQWLIDALSQLRLGYDGFVHCSDIRNPSADTPEGKKTLVARNWVRFLLQDTRYSRRDPRCNNFCALVLGINLKNLNRDCFGADRDQNIFNRFFRTTLLSGIRRFYSHDFDVVRVGRVFHGTQIIGDDNPLRWHPMWKIERDAGGNIIFMVPELTPIAADHREEKTRPRQSHLIQFIDVIIGSFSQCLDFSSGSRGCIEVAEELIPLVERLTTRPDNVRSRYYGKYGISFFPSRHLSLADIRTLERHTSTFHTARSLKIRERRQGRLFP
jgi:hypothetical protein